MLTIFRLRGPVLTLGNSVDQEKYCGNIYRCSRSNKKNKRENIAKVSPDKYFMKIIAKCLHFEDHFTEMIVEIINTYFCIWIHYGEHNLEEWL